MSAVSELGKVRAAACVNQKELADRMGEPQLTISRLEHGLANMTVDLALRYAQALDGSPAAVVAAASAQWEPGMISEHQFSEYRTAIRKTIEGLQKSTGTANNRAETAERQVRDITAEMGKWKARAKAAEAELQSVARSAASDRSKVQPVGAGGEYERSV